MHLFAHLTEKEGRDLIHMTRNNNKHEFLEKVHSREFEKKLAKMVEKENFAQKNRVMLDVQRLNYVDKRRLAIDEAKMVDVLQHHEEFRDKFNQEIYTYDLIET